MSSRLFVRTSLPLLCGLPTRVSVVSAFQTPSRWNNTRHSSWSSSQGYEKKWNSLNYAIGVGALTSAGLALYTWRRRSEIRERANMLLTLQAAERKEEKKEEEKVPIRERRYKDYASVLYRGEVYMTPRDFLESLTLDKPRAHYPETIDDSKLYKLLKNTPGRKKASSKLFRDMWNDGIITYADYLFLLTALVKTTRQFEIAFKMIDVDKSDFIDLKEFSKVQESVTRQRDNALLQQQLTQSSLTVHLFGYKGNQRLYSKDFYKFIEDLQTEVLEIEFNKYSGGSPTISEEDFARVLLQHTTWEMEPVFERLRKRPKAETGVTFEQFCDFCQLLNSLEDLGIAMTMFTIAGISVTEEEFSRAAKVCIGKPLDRAVVSTVFHIFDVDGDGKLSYREFLAVMKNWKLKRFKMRERKILGPWAEFKTCVKIEMRNRA